MSDTTIKRISGVKEFLILLLTAGSIVIGLAGFVFLPKRLDAVEAKDREQDRRIEESRDAIGELKGDVKALLRTAERIERKIQ